MEPPLTEQHAAPAPTSSTPASDPSTAARIDDRYGRTPGRRRRGRLVAIVVAAAIVVVFAAWAIWAGPGQTDHGLDTDDVGYEILSDHAAVVHTQVSVDPGTAVDCAVQVLDKSYAIVGWKVVSLQPADERSRSITTRVATTTRGVTGLIHSCWIP